ncbi:MAG: porin [Sulfurimonadaceae bacterium]
MKTNKIVLALSAAALFSNMAFADDTTDIAELKKQVAELQANQEALVDETSNSQVGFTTVDTAFSHNGMGAAASKVYNSSSPLSIGGYGEMYFASPDNGDNFADVYRFVPYIGYKFTDNIILNTEIEFEHGGAKDNGTGGYAIIEFMYLDFLLDEAFNVQVGHVLTPMGLINLRHEPTLFNTVQRPNTEIYVLPSTWHTNGLLAYGNIGESGLSYNAGVIQALDFNNDDAGQKKQIRSGRAGSDEKSTYNRAAFVGRLDYRGVTGLFVGASMYYGDASQGSVADASALMYDLHAVYEIAGFKAKALYTATKIDGADKIATANAGTINPPDGASISDADGYYVNLEYDVLATLGTTYKLPVFVQYDYINPTGTVVDSSNTVIPTLDAKAESTTTTVGLNFFPQEQVVLKLDYAMTDYADATAEDYNTISAGLGFIF